MSYKSSHFGFDFVEHIMSDDIDLSGGFETDYYRKNKTSTLKTELRPVKGTVK